MAVCFGYSKEGVLHEMILITFAKSQRNCFVIILLLSAFVFTFMVIELLRFNLLGAQAFDLGIFQQGVWLLANGYSPFVTVRGWHLFADHFSPILFIFIPFYRIWAHPFWFFLAQMTKVVQFLLQLLRFSLCFVVKMSPFPFFV